jgi:hypothetical protein
LFGRLDEVWSNGFQIDYCVRVYFGGIVTKKDDEFEDMEEESEWFDESPSFNDLCVRLNAKFDSNFTIKGRFNSGKTRAKYVLMPLRDPAYWSRYTRVLAGSNSPIVEVVVENGYRLEDDHHDDVGGDEEVVPFTSSQLYMDGQLAQEQLHSHLVGK